MPNPVRNHSFSVADLPEVKTDIKSLEPKGRIKKLCWKFQNLLYKIGYFFTGDTNESEFANILEAERASLAERLKNLKDRVQLLKTPDKTGVYRIGIQILTKNEFAALDKVIESELNHAVDKIHAKCTEIEKVIKWANHKDFSSSLRDDHKLRKVWKHTTKKTIKHYDKYLNSCDLKRIERFAIKRKLDELNTHATERIAELEKKAKAQPALANNPKAAEYYQARCNFISTIVGQYTDLAQNDPSEEIELDLCEEWVTRIKEAINKCENDLEPIFKDPEAFKDAPAKIEFPPTYKALRKEVEGQRLELNLYISQRLSTLQSEFDKGLKPSSPFFKNFKSIYSELCKKLESCKIDTFYDYLKSVKTKNKPLENAYQAFCGDIDSIFSKTADLIENGKKWQKDIQEWLVSLNEEKEKVQGYYVEKLKEFEEKYQLKQFPESFYGFYRKQIATLDDLKIIPQECDDLQKWFNEISDKRKAASESAVKMLENAFKAEEEKRKFNLILVDIIGKMEGKAVPKHSGKCKTEFNKAVQALKELNQLEPTPDDFDNWADKQKLKCEALQAQADDWIFRASHYKIEKGFVKRLNAFKKELDGKKDALLKNCGLIDGVDKETVEKLGNIEKDIEQQKNDKNIPDKMWSEWIKHPLELAQMALVEYQDAKQIAREKAIEEKEQKRLKEIETLQKSLDEKYLKESEVLTTIPFIKWTVQPRGNNLIYALSTYLQAQAEAVPELGKGKSILELREALFKGVKNDNDEIKNQLKIHLKDNILEVWKKGSATQQDIWNSMLPPVLKGYVEKYLKSSDEQEQARIEQDLLTNYDLKQYVEEHQKNWVYCGDFELFILKTLFNINYKVFKISDLEKMDQKAFEKHAKDLCLVYHPSKLLYTMITLQSA